MSKSIGAMFRERIPGHGDRPAMKSKKDGAWVSVTWPQFDRNVRALALGLDALGLKKGDSIAVISNTREEWTTIDTAAMSIGLLVVGIYQSNLAESMEYILKDCDAKACVVEDKKQLDKVNAIRKNVPTLKHVIGMQADGVPADGKSYADLIKEGEDLLAKDPKKFDKLADAVSPSDLATLVYTSGTTGLPKGAMLSHANFTDTVGSTGQVLASRPDDSTILFLPLAHIFARIVQFVGVSEGWTLYYPPYGFTPDVLFKCFEESKPTIITSVPRIFEKVYTAAAATFGQATGVKKKIIDFAMSTGQAYSKHVQAGTEPGFLLQVRHGIADKLVYSKVKDRFGGRVRYFVSGGAPLSRDIQQWFHAMDMLILEGYGMTETTAASCVNRPDKFRFGTVGPATPGTEVRIAEDGEILLKGVGVFQGYFKRPDETAEMLGKDGWLATGDIGELDADGFLKITDRKKDLMITAGGKNIAPQWVESKLKTVPLISQVMAHGDKRKFVSALITLNPDEVKKLGMSYEDAVKSPKIREMLEKEIKERNKELESYQQVKKFAILESDFTIEAGEITPTLKVKRKAVTEKYQSLLDSLYTEKKENAA